MLNDRKAQVAAATTLTAGLALAAAAAWRNRRRRVRLKEIVIYPVKAMQGCSVKEAKVLAHGLEHDREFFIVHVDASGEPKECDEETGNVGWGNQHPKLQSMAARMCEGLLVLSAGGEELKVTPSRGKRVKAIIGARGGPVWGYDQGDDAAAFVSHHGNTPCRLMWQPAEMNRKISDISRFAACPHPPGAEVKANFYSSFSLSSGASFRDLCEACAVELPECAFRHNLIVEGHDLQPYCEDTWRTVRVGDLCLHYFKRVARCNATKLKADGSGMSNRRNQPLRELQASRAGYQPCGKPGKFFGVNFNHEFSKELIIRVGDAVIVEDRRAADPIYTGVDNPYGSKG